MPVGARKHRSVLRLSLLFICSFGMLFMGLIGLRVLVPLEYRDEILQWSAAHDLDPAWVASVIRCESRFQPEAISPAGAIGLMQIMPSTGTWIAEQAGLSEITTSELVNPSLNIQLGAWYLRHLLDRFVTSDAVLMAYNAGPTYADRWGGKLELAFAETQQYVRRIHLFLPIYRIYFRVLWLVDLIPSACLLH